MTYDLKISDRAERIFFTTTDPTVWLPGAPVPAMTTLLYRVCENDPDTFNEACRLVGLFIDEARKQAIQEAIDIVRPADGKINNGDRGYLTKALEALLEVTS